MNIEDNINVAFVLKSLLSQVDKVKIWNTEFNCGCHLIIKPNASITIDTMDMGSISNFLDYIGYEVFVPDDTDKVVVQKK